MTVTAPLSPKTWTLGELLGPEVLDETATAHAVADLAAQALGRPVPPQLPDVVPVAYPFGSPATGALLRVQGRDEARQPWSLFVKVLHHVRHWVLYPMLPPEFAEEFAAQFPWRSELDAWLPAFSDLLPEGMRLPTLHQVIDLGNDRLAVWMEDIRESDEPWDEQRYERAAWLLGRLTARGTAPEILAACPYPSGFALRMWAERGAKPTGIPPLADEAVWTHPWLTGQQDLRSDLQALAEKIPAVLDRLDSLPQAMSHGDASPQNLLVPADEPDTFAVIDISFQSPHAVGFDLSQLVAGLVHAGLQPAAALRGIQDVVVDAFVTGLRDEGCEIPREQVEIGYVGSLLLRSGFTSLPYDTLSAPVEDQLRTTTFTERIALTRFTVEQARRVFGPLGGGGTIPQQAR
jgi:hypothetical protein